MNKKKIRVLLSLFFILIAFILAIIIPRCLHNKTYTVGILTNLEGNNAEFTIKAYNAVTLAYNEIKPSKKKPEVEFLAVDESFDPVKIKQSYQVLKDQCDVIMVMTTSTAFLSIYKEVLDNSDVLHMVVGPTTTIISDEEDNIIRNGLDMDQFQKKCADFFLPRTDKLLVLQESEKNKKYTFPAYNFFLKHYKGETTRLLFSAIDPKFDHILEAVKKEPFEYLYIIAGSTPRSAGLLIQKIHMIKPEIKIVVTSWVWGEILKETMGKYRKNVIVAYPFEVSKNNRYYHDFKDKLFQTYAVRPNNYANLSYDAARILFEALSAVGTSDINALKKEILSKEHFGNSGKILYNQYGDTIGNLYFYTIDEGGELTLLDS